MQTVPEKKNECKTHTCMCARTLVTNLDSCIDDMICCTALSTPWEGFDRSFYDTPSRQAPNSTTGN